MPTKKNKPAAKIETRGRPLGKPAPGLGAALRARRLARGLSVEDLAAAADLPPKSIYDYETGRHEPGLAALAALAKAMACTADSLLAARAG